MIATTTHTVQFAPVVQPDSHRCAISSCCQNVEVATATIHTHTEKKKWKRRRRRREWMNEWKKLYLIDLANLCTHSSKIRTRSHSFPDFFRPRCCRSSLFVIIALCVLTEFWSDIHLYVPMRNSVKHINGIGVHSNRNAERKKNAVWFFLSAIIPFVKSCSL